MIERDQPIKGYELIEQIGQGGFGAVYRARQTTVGREVAFKVILPRYANSPDFIRRFESEAQLVARLEHPHITPLYDFWRDPSGAYLVMRYLRGGSLRDALARDSFDLTAVSHVLDQIAGALDFAHRNDVVHRDVKPGNILFDEDSNSYLADFGLAKVLNGSTGYSEPNAVVGSLDYISPEQARSEPVTPRADIYALGVTLYEIITGKHPFHGISPTERLRKHLDEPLPQIEDLPPTVQREINAVIQKATAKDPDQRYPDVLALAAAFREGLGLGTKRDTNIVEQLTLRQQEILSLIAAGLSNQEIADDLVIELGTVKWHIKQLYKKLAVQNRVQAIVRGRELNLVLGDPPAASPPQLEPSVSSLSLPEPDNPYKGLHAFQATDARDFFGRDEFVDKLVDRLCEEDPFQRFLAIVGPSGSGKSSLVKAGLIPALWNGAISGSERWFVVDMIPGPHPLDQLEIALLRIATQHTGNLREQLQRDERGLVRVADLILPDDGSELVIAVDQFEEIFTLVEDEDMRQHFLDLLRFAVTAPRSRVRVVVTLRADYYDRPLHYPEFGELIRSRMETVLPLSANGLERAVRGPAERVGVTFEQGLVEQIVSEMTHQAGALPLLQYALTELFDRRHGRILTRDAYRQIGGAVGALANRADEIYRELTREEKELARQMFLRLVTLGEGAEDTRRRATQAELLSLSGNPDNVEELIDQFAAYRLLSLDHDPQTRQPTVEVAHEAMLREWDRLRRWLNESRADIRQQRALSRAAEEWEQQHRDESFLLRGTRLDQVERWCQRSTLVQTDLEQAFISESLLQREQERHAERERQERESRLERRSQLFLRGLLAVFALATGVSVGLLLLALDQRQSALASAAAAQNLALVSGSQTALANYDTDAALALAWQAVALNPDSALAQAQLSDAAYAPGTARILSGNQALVNRIEISSDDQFAFAGADDGTVILWDLATGEIVWQQQAHTAEVNDVAFTPDGQYVAATFNDRIMFWHSTTGRILRQIESDALDQKVVFSPSGGQFATIGKEAESHLVLWAFQSGNPVAEFDRGSEIEDLAYTPDGKSIVLASKSGVLSLVDAQTGSVIYEVRKDLDASAGALRFVELSPDGSRLYALFTDGDLVAWDLATGDSLQSFHYEGGHYALAVNPEDGTILLGGEGIIRTVDPRTGEILWTNTAQAAAIFGITLTSDGKRAVTTALDGSVRVWDLRGGHVVRRLAQGSALLFEVNLSPDARTMLVGLTDGSVTLIDVETGSEIRRLVTDQPVLAATFSPDGRTALIGTGYRFAQKVEPGHVILWDLETGEEIRRFEGQPYAVMDVEFSPDGRLAVSSGHGAMAILWDVKTGQEIGRFDAHWENGEFPDKSFWDVEFTPDGRQVLAAHSTGPIFIWDVESGAENGQLIGHIGVGAASIAFSADGKQLVSGGLDSQLILWEWPTGNLLRSFKNHGGQVGHVRFSPDRTLLLSGSNDGTNSLWHLESGEVIRRYRGGFAISPHFMSDGRHAVVGYHNGAVELWRIDAKLDDLLTWTRKNRNIPEITCEQRALYRVKPLCEPDA